MCIGKLRATIFLRGWGVKGYNLMKKKEEL